MAAQPDLLQQCFKEAASAARPALERCIEQAAAELQVLEAQCFKVAERDVIAGCWRYLLRNKSAWSERYPADLQAEFALGSLPSAPRAPSPQTLRAASTGRPLLSLIDETEVNQAIDSQRLLQHLLPSLEQALAELDALVSSALGLTRVMPERNPLRPEVFARVLQNLMAGTLSDAPFLAMGVKQMASPLGYEIKQTYKKIIATLRAAHIPAAPYQFRVQQTSPTSSALHALVSPPGGQTSQTGLPDHRLPQPGQQYADPSNLDIQAAMFEDFLAHGINHAEHGLTASYYAHVDQELAALTTAPPPSAAPLSTRAQIDATCLSAVDRPPRYVDVSSPLSEQVWGPYGTSRARSLVRTQLKKEATKVGQVLGLDVVRQLVNHVAQDPRLLTPVREAIVALEPSLLRLAMLDPRFFSDDGHSGRRLMERVAQRSFKYNDEFSPEFAAFFQSVTRSFNDLNAQKIEDAKTFDMALAKLEYAWDEQDQQELAQRQQALKALHFAEDRQTQADQIAFDLSSRSDLDQVPGVVLDFLFGPWALAMAHARLADQRRQVDPEGFGSVVPDLLWSVKRDVTLKRPAQLIEMIPALLERLHSGLAMLGQNPKENEKFFESLMKLHRPVLKLRRLKSQRDAEESVVMQLAPDELSATPFERLEKLRSQSGEQPWLGRDDLDAAGFEDTLPTAPAGLLPLDAVQTEAAQDTADQAPVVIAETTLKITTDITQQQAEALLFSLRAGSWIDLYSKRQWLRAQLIWASSKATLFMFISHGGQPHSMTKRSCEKLIMQRWLRRVETHSVVAQALDAVALDAAHQTRRAAVPSPAKQSELEPA